MRVSVYRHVLPIFAALEKGDNPVAVEVLDAAGRAVGAPEIVHPRLRRAAI